MKDRIRLIMEEQHLTQQSFAQLLGISPAQLSGIFKDRTKPTLNIVDAIHQKFPQINLSWLLYGIEPMYINKESIQEGQSFSSSLPEETSPSVEGLAFDFSDEGADGNVQNPSSAKDDATNAAIYNNRRIPNSQFAQGSLFDQPQKQGVSGTLKNMPQGNVKYIDKPQRKITEIRIFYDDQTWETFVPKK